MQKFWKEGANLGYLKKRGAQLQAASGGGGGHWKTMFKN